MTGLEYLLVRADALPDVLLRTLAAKELITSGECRTVREAVARVGMSRSAFYKYRDSVERAGMPGQEPIVATLSLLLSHRAGVLSRVLQLIAAASGNIRTINQSAPVNGAAPVLITFESAALSISLADLLGRLQRLDGVVKAELLKGQVAAR